MVIFDWRRRGATQSLKSNAHGQRSVIRLSFWTSCFTTCEQRRGRTVTSVRELGLTRGHREESLFVAQFITNAIMNSIKIKLGVSLNKYSGYAWHDLFYTLVMS